MHTANVHCGESAKMCVGEGLKTAGYYRCHAERRMQGKLQERLGAKLEVRRYRKGEPVKTRVRKAKVGGRGANLPHLKTVQF